MNMIIKRVLISILSMILSLVILPISAFASCGIIVIQSGKLNIRNGPGKAWKVIGKASKGSAVNILGSRDYWYKVKLNNGRIGYARMDYVSEGESTCGIVAIQTGRLNIRSRPTKSSRVVSKVAKNSALRTLQWNSSYWIKVKLNNGRVGYVSSEYVTGVYGPP